MKETEMKDELQELMQGTDSRRSFLARVAVAGLGVAALGLIKPSEVVAATQPKQPEADTGHNYPMAKPTAMTEAQFRKGVIGPAMLSLLTSQIAVDKATNPLVLEFANFELREAIGVTTILKEMKTPVPPMDAVAKATLQKIKSTPKGAEFDKAYATAQLANHEFLRDLAEVYLKNSAGHTSMKEMHGRHLAILTLGAFKEHVVHTKNLVHMM
jgi:predicted outer membrane protein